MRKHLFPAFLVSGALLLSTVSVSLAAAPTVDLSSPAGYYLWNDDSGSHLRTHGPDANEHDFDAVLHTDGTFTNVNAIRLDAVNMDRVEVTDGGHALVMHFHTFNFVDGVDFTVDSGKRISGDLKMDGQPIDTSMIFVGADQSHPNNDPFVLQFKNMDT
jgi:hypothetical protein